LKSPERLRHKADPTDKGKAELTDRGADPTDKGKAELTDRGNKVLQLRLLRLAVAAGQVLPQ